MDKRVQIQKYFKPFPKWAAWCVVIGLPLLALKGSGIVLIALGVWGIVSWSKKPSDEQIDAWFAEDLKALNDRALSKTGTDPSELVGETVPVTGPRLWDLGGAVLKSKVGKDKVLRYTPINVVIINFTQNQLVVYSCAYDQLTGNALSESTDEYFYRDVVSVSTKSISKRFEYQGQEIQLTSAETFTLTTSGGTSVEIVLKDPKLIQMMGGGSISTSRAEQAIQVVRKMLREKKSVAA